MYNMKYSIALNSRDRTNGGVPNDCEFPFDFGGFKAGDYELSFTFVSDPQFIGSLHSSAQLGVSAATSDEQLIAGNSDNGGVYLHSAPREQTIKIRLLDGTGTAFTAVGGTCPEWIMMMTFTKHDDSYPR